MGVCWTTAESGGTKPKWLLKEGADYLGLLRRLAEIKPRYGPSVRYFDKEGRPGKAPGSVNVGWFWAIDNEIEFYQDYNIGTIAEEYLHCEWVHTKGSRSQPFTRAEQTYMENDADVQML